jgi:hypothetical protein
VEDKKQDEKKIDTPTDEQEKTREDVSASEIAQTIKNRRLQLEMNKQEMEKKQAEERERY